MKEKYPTTSVSFPDEGLLEAAKLRARALGMSFSRYVNYLVERDVQRGGAFVLDERRIEPTEAVKPGPRKESDAQRTVRETNERAKSKVQKPS